MLEILHRIVRDNGLHAKWLNTLSFMENAGARKISGCEHAVNVNLLQLKHAAEEHRHAYYLKKQILKLSPDACKTYNDAELLAPKASRYYLQALDLQCSRYLKRQFFLSGDVLKYAAYLFVTYAIEVRADFLYPQYQNVLTEVQHSVMVKSIILEEEGHLQEMTAQLIQFNKDWEQYAAVILDIEEQLFEDWIQQLEQELQDVHY